MRWYQLNWTWNKLRSCLGDSHNGEPITGRFSYAARATQCQSHDCHVIQNWPITDGLAVGVWKCWTCDRCLWAGCGVWEMTTLAKMPRKCLGWNIIHGLIPFFRPIQFTDFSRFLDQFIYSMTFQGPGSHFFNFHDFSRIPGPLGTLYSVYKWRLVIRNPAAHTLFPLLAMLWWN